MTDGFAERESVPYRTRGETVWRVGTDRKWLGEIKGRYVMER